MGKLIKTYLNISDFKLFKSKFKYSEAYPKNLLNKSEFIDAYNFFKSIFTGEAYENRILDNNELYTFIKTKSNTSFRKYIIQLITNIYFKCQKNYEEKNRGFYYVNEYLKNLAEIITNSNDIPKHKVNDPWPTNLNVGYTVFTNEQLIIIYQYVVLEDFENLGIKPKPKSITPIIEESKVPENWEDEVVEETKDEIPKQIEESKVSSYKEDSDDILLQLLNND